MAKRAKKAATDGRTLQSICDTILDAHGVNPAMKGKALIEKVLAVRDGAKPASIKQSLNIWRKKKGLVRSRTTVKRAKPGRPAVSDGRPRAATNLMETLRRVTALAHVIDLPQDKLPEIIKALS